MALPRFQVQAVAFDLDGVLVDTEAMNIGSAFEAFEAFGHSLKGEAKRRIVGRHPVDYVPELARPLGLPEETQQRLISHQNEIFLRMWRGEIRLKPGAREVPLELRRQGYRLALASSGGRDHVEECLRRFDLWRFFELVLTKDDVSRRKPDPEMYVACARRFAIEPAAMLVVEDSEHGVRAARASGAPCVAVRTPHVPRRESVKPMQ